ncbi:MAG: metal-dependent hydrolase [Flavobacteriales bacterium]|nr:putative metal-dependent hydrolase [Flavobacteriaceae bacterium]PHX92416.1 MAG: metal-dependent hydrolase [Flavobacteriales bacterium]
MSLIPNLPKFECDAPISIGGLLEDVMSIEQFPNELAKTLQGINGDQLNLSYRQGAWTIKQIVHHLADSHMNAYIRCKHIITQDQEQIQPYDENAWANTADSNFHHEASYLILLGLHQKWSLLLLESLKDFERQLAKTIVHPETHKTLNLGNLIRLYAWHGSHHLAQIKFALESNQQ